MGATSKEVGNGQVKFRTQGERCSKNYQYINPNCEQSVNWIIQGLPDSGVEEVFGGLVKKLSTDLSQSADCVPVEIDFSSFWTNSVSNCVESILNQMPEIDDLVESQGDRNQLNDLLASLSRRALDRGKRGGSTIFIFTHFDAIAKFRDLSEVQQFLNILQEVCYNPKFHCANLVQCYNDIEDICQTTNYSDYYKIFGSNHYRVTNIHNEDLESAIKEHTPKLNSNLLAHIVKLSAGYPEHAEVLLRFVGEADIESITRSAADAMAMTFKKWESSLTSAEIETLNLIKAGASLGLEHLSPRNKLRRKGIITESNNSLQIASPMFEIYLSERQPKIDNEQSVFIKGVGNLNPIHCQMFENLFRGHYYIEWKLLQAPLPGNATVYLISGEDKNANPYRPWYS